jgi:hypothetical protein
MEKDYANRPDLLRTLVRGEWGITVRGREVYPEFRRDVHVSREPLLQYVRNGIVHGNRTIFRGWDNTGLSPACVLGYLTNGGELYLFKEFTEENMGILEFGTSVKLWCAANLPEHVSYRDYGDPAGKVRDAIKMSPHQYLQTIGINVMDSIQTFKTRRESVAKRLMNRVHGLVVDPACTRLIDGFEGGYAYPEIGSSGVFKDEPAKNHYSHIHDSCQYLCAKIYSDVNEPQAEDLVPAYAGDW